MVGAGELNESIAEAVGRAKADDPMTEVWVVMPSGSAAGSALNELARTAGFINVRFVTIEHLARTLTESTPTKPRLGSAIKRELVRVIAQDAHPPLDVFRPDTLSKSLGEVFDDLGRRSSEEVERIAEVNWLTAELVRLYKVYRSEIADKYSDRSDLLVAATDAMLGGVLLPSVVAVVVEPPGAHETALLHALSDRDALQVVAIASGVAEFDATIEPWLWGMAELETDAPLVRKPVDSVVVTPDADTEVQVAVAQLLQHAGNNIPFSRMALLYTARSPYARIVEDQMRAARVPVRGSATLKLSQTLAGGFVDRLLDVVDTDFEYESVAAWLLGLDTVDGADWLRAARRARVNGGCERWAQRLRLNASERMARNPDDPTIAAASSFAEFLDGLAPWLAEQPNSWQGWAEWLQGGLERYLGSHGARESWPYHQAQSAVRVENRIAHIAQLDSISSDVSRDVFIEAVREDLAAHTTRGGGRSGVFTGTVGEAVASNFDVVVICGMAEGLFPRPPEKDGLLTALTVPGEEVRSERDERLFRLRIDAGGYRMLTMPVSDVRAQRPMRPSTLLLDEAALLAGRPVNAGEIIEGSDKWSWLEVFHSFTQVVAQPGLQMSGQFDDVAALHQFTSAGGDCVGSGIVINAEMFSSGVEALRNRDSDEFTRHDGLVGAPVALGGTDSTPLRVTELERWAQCPFRYLMDSVLKVEFDDDDSSLLTISPRDRGELVHSVLETFITNVETRTSPEQPWNEDERQMLHGIVDTHFERAVQRGVAPGGFTTDTQRQALHRQLETLLDDDELMRTQLQVVPVAVETGFGMGGVPAVSVTTSRGEAVWFRGRIDRVDAAADGSRAVVTDYKTGKSTNAPKVSADPLAAGRSLQLSIYAKAVQRSFPEAKVKSDYWYVTDENSGYKREGIELDDQTNERVGEVFELIHGSFEAGAFPAVPGDEDGRTSFKNCRNCPYDPVCPRDRLEAWSRKSEAPEVSSYLALSEPAE